MSEKAFKFGDLVTLKSAQKSKLNKEYSEAYFVIKQSDNLPANTTKIAKVKDQAMVRRRNASNLTREYALYIVI